MYDFCLPIDLCKPEAMDSESAAASERILLEPYKYLLQLPGESFSLFHSDCREKEEGRGGDR